MTRNSSSFVHRVSKAAWATYIALAAATLVAPFAMIGVYIVTV